MAPADTAIAALPTGRLSRWSPVARLRQRLQHWFESRLTRRDTMELTQRNVYILPTGAGLMLATTLLVLLVASINYQLNLGYLLTFLLAGCAVVGMHVCHGNLRGIAMHLLAPSATFAGTSTALDIQLSSKRKALRPAIGVAVLGSGHWSWTDVPGQGSCKVQVGFAPPQRGIHPVPTLTLETRFPLGTFRVWTVWRPASTLVVYPRPEAHPPPLPASTPVGSGQTTAPRSQATGEFDGVRAYRRGDALKLVVWKKAAKNDELVSRDAVHAQRSELWLDLQHAGSGDLENKLSRLCAWVLLAEKRGLDYGLRLGAQEIAPAQGPAQQARCLQALARY
ncbi:DUF58 domain-containing protein [Curvibacter sp. APW13]|uniref:DUF58 domain-containing protein n=1 Tax=Curvibacter sp. APW13 TaxID=3077236 RepID=UPI0028DE00B5|nr:DUF58 domain-containing protein [Curvibacter sp. APW13]MDT8992037.1 DUF58 domain-containing protein [Curvibacter sp. APW13]